MTNLFENIDIALGLTAYERFGTVGFEEILEMAADELDVTEDMISEYNEYLSENQYETYFDSLDDILDGYSPMEVVRMTFYGNFNNPYDDYFKFNGYGNIDSFSSYQVVQEMKNDSDFLRWYIENYCDLDESEFEEEIAKANELIRKGY